MSACVDDRSVYTQAAARRRSNRKAHPLMARTMKTQAINKATSLMVTVYMNMAFRSQWIITSTVSELWARSAYVTMVQRDITHACHEDDSATDQAEGSQQLSRRSRREN